MSWVRPRIKKSRRLFLIASALTLCLTLWCGVCTALYVTTPAEITYSPQAGTTMQGFTNAMCSSMDTYSTVLLVDTRNNQEYRVRKMPDGRCWMIDNLKLSDFTLTASDSDVTNSFVLPSNPVQGASTRLTNGVCHGGTVTGTGVYLTCDGVETVSATNLSFVAFSDPSGVENATSYACLRHYGTSPDSKTGCGYLYNWYTATAGTGDYNISSGVASSSLCPVGWRLPTGGDNGEFAILNGAMATGKASSLLTNSRLTRPNWFSNGPFEGSLAGSYNSGFASAGYSGRHWSSSASSEGVAYGTIYYIVSILPGTGGHSKRIGQSVRCILR